MAMLPGAIVPEILNLVANRQISRCRINGTTEWGVIWIVENVLRALRAVLILPDLTRLEISNEHVALRVGTLSRWRVETGERTN